MAYNVPREPIVGQDPTIATYYGRGLARSDKRRRARPALVLSPQGHEQPWVDYIIMSLLAVERSRAH
jgi:hypothetical protein